MKTYLDCIPCFVRQALEAARMVSADAAIHERVLREVLRWSSEMDMSQPPPAMGQRIHRLIRALTGVDDPYRPARERQNRMALLLLSEMREEIAAAADSFAMAVRLAIAGNVIDMGVNGQVNEADVRASLRQALDEPFSGDLEGFRRSVAEAGSILYLADNAGEIVFDRLLIEQMGPARVTLAVRGGPVINDATRADARAAGLPGSLEIVDNGSDAPGTLLPDCSDEFRRCFAAADMVVAKGQGNYETLSRERRGIHFLFKAKCPMIAEHAGVALGAHVLLSPQAGGGKEENIAMEKDETNRILEGEIVDNTRDGSPPLPTAKAPAPKAVRTGNWIEVIAAIGGGIIRWLASSSPNPPSRGGNQTGRGGGGGKMRRRRGGGR